MTSKTPFFVLVLVVLKLPLLGVGPRAVHTISKPHITEQFFISLKAYCILFTDCVVPVHVYIHHGMHVKSEDDLVGHWFSPSTVDPQGHCA